MGSPVQQPCHKKLPAVEGLLPSSRGQKLICAFIDLLVIAISTVLAAASYWGIANSLAVFKFVCKNLFVSKEVFTRFLWMSSSLVCIDLRTCVFR